LGRTGAQGEKEEYERIDGFHIRSMIISVYEMKGVPNF
jgi:hypothetical protein